MPRFVSETYPELRVYDLGVRFTNGEAEVPAAKAKALKAAGIPGVRAVGGRPTAQKDDAQGGDQKDGDQGGDPGDTPPKE